MAFHIEGWINWVAFKETMGIDGCQCKKTLQCSKCCLLAQVKKRHSSLHSGLC